MISLLIIDTFNDSNTIGWVLSLIILLTALFYLIGLYLQDIRGQPQAARIGSYHDLTDEDSDDGNMELTDEELLEW